MLESRPPDRKLDTGTSATRCAVTDSLITVLRSAAGPAAASSATSAMRQYCSTREAAVGADARPRAGRELPHPLDGALLIGHPVIEHRRHHGARLDPQLRSHRGDEGLQLRGEDQARASRQVVERLDAERVTGQDEIARRLVGQREREHAAEPAQRRRTPGAPGLEHDLGVGFGDEAHAASLQLGPQLLVVVELAVVDEGQAVLGHRLVGGGGQIDDRKPPMAEVHGDPVVLVAPGSRRIRAAMRDPVGHDVDQLLAVGLLVTPRDPAHVQAFVRSEPCPGSGAA